MYVLNIVITNDDGIYSEGIIALASEIKKMANVTVVAPDRERSATAHAITMHKPLRVEKINMPISEVPGYKVNGTPSDCVKLAIEALLDFTPDMVLSGINRGANLGNDVIYSGTVSAALEATVLGVPAIAFSVAGNEDIDFSFPARFAKSLCQQISEKVFPKGSLLNVNIPSLDEGDVEGISITHLGIRKYKDSFDKRTDPRGREYYWLAGEVVEDLSKPNSDVSAIKNNKISITPIHFDLTKYELIDTIQKWNLKL